MFGNDVRAKDKPVKGYKYLGFTILMIILLSIMVLLNAKSLEDIKNDRLREESKNFFDDLEKNKTKQQDKESTDAPSKETNDKKDDDSTTKETDT